MKYFFSIILVIAAYKSNPQTCIIAKKTKDAIYVGADSKVKKTDFRLENGKIIIDTSSELICKIYTDCKFNFAIAGSLSKTAKNEALKACKNATSFKEAMTIYSKNFLPILSNSLSALGKADYQKYLDYIKGKEKSISSILFFGVESDTLVMYALIVEIVNQPNREITLTAKLLKNMNEFTMGNVEEIIDTVSNKNTWKGNIIKTIDRLIEEQAKRHPPSISKPVDIVKITRVNKVWIRKKKDCY